MSLYSFRIWVKIKIKNGQDKIIGNVYRPNTDPRASLEQSIQIHNDIIEKIKIKLFQTLMLICLIMRRMA